MLGEQYRMVMRAVEDEFRRVGVYLSQGDLDAIGEFFRFLDRSPTLEQIEAYAAAHQEPCCLSSP